MSCIKPNSTNSINSGCSTCKNDSICSTIREGQEVIFTLKIQSNNSDCCSSGFQSGNSIPCCQECYDSQNDLFNYLPNCEETIIRPTANVNIVNETTDIDNLTCEQIIDKCKDCINILDTNPCHNPDAEKYRNVSFIQIPVQGKYDYNQNGIYYYQLKINENYSKCCYYTLKVSVLNNPNGDIFIGLGRHPEDPTTVYTNEIRSVELDLDINYLLIKTIGKKDSIELQFDDEACTPVKINFTPITPDDNCHECNHTNPSANALYHTFSNIWTDTEEYFVLNYAFLQICCEGAPTFTVMSFSDPDNKKYEVIDSKVYLNKKTEATEVYDISIKIKAKFPLQTGKEDIKVVFVSKCNPEVISTISIDTVKTNIDVLDCDKCPEKPVDCKKCKEECPPDIIDNTKYLRIVHNNNPNFNISNCECITQKFVFTINTNYTSYDIKTVEIFGLTATTVDSYDVCDNKITVFVRSCDKCSDTGFLKVVIIDNENNLYEVFEPLVILSQNCPRKMPDDCCNFPCQVVINYEEIYRDISRLRIKLKVSNSDPDNTIEAILIDDWDGRVITNLNTIKIKDGAEVYFELKEGTWEQLIDRGLFYLQINFISCTNNTIYIPFVEQCKDCNLAEHDNSSD